MNAIEVLEAQHAEVKKLFKQIEKAKDSRTSRRLFDRLAAVLVVHDAIERAIFYPAREHTMGMADLLGEALVEHGLIELSLYQADAATAGEGFKYKVTVLREVVEHHVQEEEEELFPKVSKALGKEFLACVLLKQLGVKLEARLQATKTDYRAALHESRRQVRAGDVKTAESRALTNGNSKASAQQFSLNDRARLWIAAVPSLKKN